MQLSTRGRYAVMAMVELAVRESRPGDCGCGPVCLAEIAASQLLSLSYLEQLFGRLRRAGLVVAARGPGGGYRLSRPAAEISIAAVVAAVDEPIHATRCEAGGGGCMLYSDTEAGPCRTHDLWQELGQQIHLFLDGITLADVIGDRVLGRAAAPAPAAPAEPQPA
jgi:Rrf2 family transcriptional regulator, iron-sulfur cluster assembly transcription factor